MRKLYYWRDHPNFGDELAPLLLRHFSGMETTWAPLDEAELVVTGSVLHHVGPNWSGAVVGAGFLDAHTSYRLGSFTRLLAVRGPLTAKRLFGDRQTPVLGDPGLLADELVTVDTKRYDIGIVPHWTDFDLGFRPEFRSDRWTARVISPQQGDPLDVVRLIGECRKIVTSSLHGMIVADAFGIPRRVETCERTLSDTMFKFEDYSASIGMPFRIGETQKAHRGYVEARKHELWDVFERLRAWKS